MNCMPEALLVPELLLLARLLLARRSAGGDFRTVLNMVKTCEFC